MFRISRYLHALKSPSPARPPVAPGGPVVIWNLVRRCNLSCKHCYSTSADIDFPGDSKMIRYMGGESEIKFIVGRRNPGAR